jgi:hypothetical protein
MDNLRSAGVEVKILDPRDPASGSGGDELLDASVVKRCGGHASGVARILCGDFGTRVLGLGIDIPSHWGRTATVYGPLCPLTTLMRRSTGRTKRLVVQSCRPVSTRFEAGANASERLAMWVSLRQRVSVTIPFQTLPRRTVGLEQAWENDLRGVN